jgi:CubicO group peptidase (beta-lactamase class C family)
MRKTISTWIAGWQTGILLVLLAAVTSCSKTSNSGSGPAAQFVSFSFPTGINKIPVSSEATIQGTDVSIFLPPGTDISALIATFKVSGNGVVTVNGKVQQSGTTPNDFSSPVSYTVTSPGGVAQIYTVTLTTGISAIDQGVTALMTQYHLPGLAIAITQNDRLVYVGSYGLASVENNEPVTNQSLFRISSLSKQITSVAILRLVDQNKLTLTTPVFGPAGILGTSYGSQPYGPGITNITVSDLLHHTEGGWPDNNTDPFGSNFSYSIPQLVSWGLNNVPLLDTIPGRSYYYSHFGYVVLGRVIEKLTGLAYSDAIQQLVLQPCGILDMKIGGDILASRFSNEVEYYDQNGNDPYFIPISRMDAANGWIASATDMARFLSHVDGMSTNTILSPNSLNTMTTGSYPNPKYGCGWQLNQYNIWHHGSWPGTGATQAITTQNGKFNYVILANSGSSDANFGGDMDNVFWNAVNQVQSWPAYDLFQQ